MYLKIRRYLFELIKPSYIIFFIILISAFFSFFFKESALYQTKELPEFILAYFVTALLLELFAESTVGIYLSNLVAKLENIKSEKGRLLEDYYKSDESKYDTDNDKILKHDHAVAQENLYKLKNMQDVYYSSVMFCMGLLLAISGLRILSYFVDTSMIENNYQIGLFNFLDMVITAGALSGGSLAIKKFGIAVMEFSDVLTSKNPMKKQSTRKTRI